MPGLLNPADISSRDSTLPDEVGENSIWQGGPSYLSLPREQWPFSRDFIDTVPDSELRSPKAVFNAATVEPWKNLLAERLSSIVLLVMERSNCLAKTVHVAARLLKCYFNRSQEKIGDTLTVHDIKVAHMVQFIASMELTVKALSNGELEPLRPTLDRGIVYDQSRCDKDLMKLLGVPRLPVLSRQSRLAYLIMLEANAEDHRSSHTDVLARSRQRAWIIRGRFLAKEICKSCPLCRLNKRKLSQQLMADIPEHQLYPCPPFSFVSLDFAGPFEAKAM